MQEHLKQKTLKAGGEVLGRAGISERILVLSEQLQAEPTYKNAVRIAGRMSALADACRFDCYWREKSEDGFQDEAFRIFLALRGEAPPVEAKG